MEMNNMALGRELAWDDEINEERQEYVLLPEGDYPFTVVSLEKARHEPRPGGKLPPCAKAIVTIRIHSENEQADIKHNFFLHTSQEWKLGEFFRAIGQKRKDEPLRMNWGLVVGSKGTCHVQVRDYQRRDGQTGKSNEINRFYPADEKPAAPTGYGGYTPGQF